MPRINALLVTTLALLALFGPKPAWAHTELTLAAAASHTPHPQRAQHQHRATSHRARPVSSDRAQARSAEHGLGGDRRAEARSAEHGEWGHQNYVYDTWGRLQQMTYPDGEVLTYQYDSGGLVSAVNGQKLGNPYPYVQRLEHDKLAQRAYMVAGNGVVTSYQYDHFDRGLERLTAGDFQDLRYTYDDVGNITALENQVPVPAGGPTSRSTTTAASRVP